jgi:drug/metabolite transporter (DMT)-like permease
MLVFGTAGNIFLDKGMKRIGAIELSSSQMIWSGAARILTSGAIWSGIFLLLLYMLSYMLVLSWADYSFVMPFTALSYAMVAVSGYVLLGEAVPVMRWVGIALIVGGVFLVSRTPTSTTKSAATAGNLSDITAAANRAVAANNGSATGKAAARAAAGGR